MDLNSNVFVISSISKCFHDRRRTLLELLLCENQSVLCTIKRYFYADRDILFLCLVPTEPSKSCGISAKRHRDEVVNLRFDFVRALTLCFVVSNIVLLEVASLSLDYDMLNILCSVNDLRVRIFDALSRNLNGTIPQQESDALLASLNCMGRMYVPDLLLLALHDGTVRRIINSVDHSLNDLMETKKRNLYALLEELFRQCKLNNAHNTSNSLFFFPENGIYVCCSAETDADARLISCFDGIGCHTRHAPASQHPKNNKSGVVNDKRLSGQHNKVFVGLIDYLSSAVRSALRNYTKKADGYATTDGRCLATLAQWMYFCDGIYTVFTVQASTENNFSPMAFILEDARKELIEKEIGGLCLSELEGLAMGIYTEGLPDLYDASLHEKKLEKMFTCLDKLNLPSPLPEQLNSRLTDRCSAIFANRRACESRSVLGYQCILKADHVRSNLEVEKSSINGQAATRHSSAVFLLSASNCGRAQQRRADPFTVKEANYDFYRQFQSKIEEFTLNFEFLCYDDASIKADEVHSRSQSSDTCSQDSTYGDVGRVVQNILDRVGDFDEGHISDLADENNPYGISVDEDALCVASVDPDHNSRSTSEMMHSGQPRDFLPLFSSWNLCCIGRYADYDVNEGIKQPGFIKHMNLLTPLHLETPCDESPGVLAHIDYEGETAVQEPKQPFYVGCEYECGLGHRFIRRPHPDSEQNKDGSDSTEDMPLYVVCPLRRLHMREAAASSLMESNAKEFCRDSSVAQLMRLFAACPKPSRSQVSLSLKPQVTVPLDRSSKAWSPLFMPSYRRPIVLEADAIWVLRLPFVYALNGKLLRRPTAYDLVNGVFSKDPLSSGKVLASLLTPIVK